MMNISIFQIYIFVLLSWIYKYYRYEYTFDKTLEKGNELLMLEDIRTLRSLAIYEHRNELKNITYDDNYKHMKEKRNTGTYAKLKERNSNNFEDYKKNMNSRLNKKKGLKKLDCYCENKIFNSMDKFDNLVENMNSNKGIIKKILFKKFRLRIILTFLFATSGIIFTALDSINVRKCQNSAITEVTYLEDKLGMTSNIVHMIFALFFIIGIINFLVCIYFLIKIIKYEGIKRGKRKMKPKEYYYLFKESFSTK